MQNPTIAEKQKNAFKFKEYIFPCGSIEKIQGYEGFALDLLILNGYYYTDLVLKKTEVPEIWYYENNKKHRYYCDIFIEKENKIIEVKSIYTYERDKSKNILKQNACIEQGYIFEFWFFDPKGNIINNVDADNNTICKFLKFL